MATDSETAPLLRQESATKVHSIAANGEVPGHDTLAAFRQVDGASPRLKTSWRAEAKLLGRYSAPLVVTYILQYSYSLATVIVAGRLGTSELAAASLASMTANITGLAIYEGLATSLDTLTSQAFGAGKKHLVGLHVQRMVALTWLVTIPIGIVWICSPWLLARLVPETEVAYLAGGFMRFYLIGAPGYGTFEAVKRFTQAQGDFVGPMVTALVCAPLNIFWNWLLVFKLGWGFWGAGVAVSVSNHTQPIIFLLYVKLFAPDALQCWPGLHFKQAFENWTSMIKLAVPGVIMILSEWLAFDLLTLSASYLSEQHLAAQSILMTIAVFIYHIPFPISIAASTRFGNLIGLGDLIAARIAFNTYYTIFAGLGVFDITLLISMRHSIAQTFTGDPAVRAIIVTVLPIVAAAQLFDAVCALSNGMCRGMGRQAIAGWVNLGVYYCFAIPLSLFLTFGPLKLELGGLWIGPVIGLGLTALILYVYMHYSDWGKAVGEARLREE